MGFDHVNRAQPSDGFVVDMESFSHLIEKDVNGNSRIALQRNFKSKGCLGSSEKNISHTTTNQRNAILLATSSAATLNGDGTPEEQAVVTPTTSTRPANPKPHHQITIKNSGVSSPTAKSRDGGNRIASRSTPQILFIHPIKIVIFFATLSSIGTILLIYFTLSIRKLNEDLN